MKKTLHRARGVVCLTVTGGWPERFFNACAKQGVRFWGAEPVDEVTVRLYIHERDRRKAQSIGKRLFCQVEESGREGLPRLWQGMRRRYGMLAGLTLCVAAVLVLSRFVLTVEVSGNETVPTAVILSELRRQGVKPGAFAPGLDEAAIAQAALTRLEGLSWMAVNLHGTRAQVLVRESLPRPELDNDRIAADVVADTTGLVTHLETWQGKALVSEGDMVVEGDVVISGWVPFEPPAYSDLPDLGGMEVRAQGRVEARTWRTLTAGLPAEGWVKEPTGREKTLYALTFFGKRINFYRKSGISFGEYDKITQVKPLALPGGIVLPISLTVETVRETEQLSFPLDRDAAGELLKGQLQARLTRWLEEDGEQVTEEFTLGKSGGLLTGTLLAECREEIGKTVERNDP